MEPEHTGVDVNVGDLKDEALKCHIETWHNENIYILVEFESFVIELSTIGLNWIFSHLDESLES